MHTHRLRWALSQRELARLIGRNSHSAVSRYERLGKIPPLRTLLAYEVIFGEGLGSLLPTLYREVEDAVMARAAALWKELEGRRDDSSRRKRELLLDMVRRADSVAADHSGASLSKSDRET